MDFRTHNIKGAVLLMYSTIYDVNSQVNRGICKDVYTLIL